jgi:26S proteasome regulatory subunit T6
MVRDGIKGFYRAKIEEAEGEIHEKTQNLRRLEAQRNALNAKGKLRVYSMQLYCFLPCISRK